jgi:hypothetical protein
MRKHSLFIIFLLFAFTINAQYPGYKQVADISSFKKQFAEASQKANTIKSDFVQEKNLSMLSEKIV